MREIYGDYSISGTTGRQKKYTKMKVVGLVFQFYTLLSLSSYLILFIPLYFASSEFAEDRPSSLVTRGVSTETLSPSGSRTEESEEVLNRFISFCCLPHFLPLFTWA